MATALLSWNEEKFTHDQGIFTAFLASASSKDNLIVNPTLSAKTI
jgi:hypothetical protein